MQTAQCKVLKEGEVHTRGRLEPILESLWKQPKSCSAAAAALDGRWPKFHVPQKMMSIADRWCLQDRNVGKSELNTIDLF